MAAYDASIKKALSPEQDDLIDHKEHCSADPEKLATAGRALRHQVRIKRNDDEYGLYTVSDVRQENPDNIVRMGKGGRERLGTSDEFDGTLDSQVPDATLADDAAERKGEFVERVLTITTTLRQQGRDVLEYLIAASESAGGRLRPACLLPDSS
jgi:hypothetical protein